MDRISHLKLLNLKLINKLTALLVIGFLIVGVTLLFRAKAAPCTKILNSANYSSGFTVPKGETWCFDPNQSVTITSPANVVVYGTLQMRPASVAIVHTLRFTGIDETKFVGSGQVVLASDIGLWVMDSGVLDAVGAAKTAWTHAAGTVNKGATSITLEAIPTGWQVGDEISIAPTESPSVGSASWSGFDNATITSLNGATVTFNSAAAHAHPLVNNTWKAEVMNLTRNVNVEGTATGRSHLFIHGTVPQTIAYVGIRYMGPRKNLDSNPAFTEFVPGRYGLHFHEDYGGSRGSSIQGVVVRDGGSHAFVPHASNGITFKDDIAFNNYEESFWWDQNRTSNLSDPIYISNDIVFDHDIAAQVKTINPTAGFTLAGYLLGIGSGNAVVNSVAVGVQGNADASGYEWPETASSVWKFSDDTAHNNKAEGIYAWNKSGALNQKVDRFTSYYNNTNSIFAGPYGTIFAYSDSALYGDGNSNATDRRNANLILYATSAADQGTSTPRLEREAFSRVTLDGGNWSMYNIRISKHVLATSTQDHASRLVDCNLNNFTKHPVLIEEKVDGGANPGYYDFIRCKENGKELQPTDFQVTSQLGTVRVQRSDGTAFKISKGVVTSSIPAFDLWPTVGLSAPAANTTLSSSVSLTATATKSSVSGALALSRVDFLVDGTVVASDTTSPYSATWVSSSVTAGTHYLSAVAYTTSGTFTASAPIKITTTGK